MEDIILKVDDCDEGKRIDGFILSKLNSSKENNDYLFTRTKVQEHIKNEKILLNGCAIKKSKTVKSGDTIKIEKMSHEENIPVPQNLSIDIVYEDADLLIVNKKKGMVVHPAPGNYDFTLVNALLFYFKDCLSTVNGSIRPGIVHRIDKNTSGLLVVAKNDFSHVKIAEKIKTHDFLREYEAVVYGKVKNKTGTINAPIGRNPKFRKKMAVTTYNSREAITHYKLLNHYIDEKGQIFSHVRLRLETGRTHQIRVHMAYIGHPLAGDDIYGPKNVISSLHGQCLHAKTIGLKHPRTENFLKVTSELPDYFKEFLEKLNLVLE